MSLRSNVWWPAIVLLPGALLSACSETISTISLDAAIDVSIDGSVDAARPDGSVDAGGDAKVLPDAGDDAKVPPDVTTDLGDDAVTPDDVIVDDAVTPDDVLTPDVVVDDVPATPDVGVDVAPPIDVPPGACALPLQRALTLPSDRVTGASMGMGRVGMSTCAAVGGPEHLFPLRVTARTGVVLSTEGSMFDTVLLLRRTCDSAMPASELACNDDVPGGTTSLLRRVLDPGDYYVVLDQYGNADGRGGMYTLNVSSFTPAANGECSGAAALTPGTPATGNTNGGLAASTACLNELWGPQVFYTLTIPAGQRATVTATPSGTPAWRPVVRAQNNCMTNACVASGAAAMAGEAASEVIDNRGATPLTVVVSVASASGSTGGAFTLNAALSTPPMAPPNATCATATMVADGATITGDNPGLGITRLNGVCVGGAQGTSLYYRAVVPARSTLEFSADPAAGWDAVVRLLNGCAATTCLASVDNGGAGASETLRWTNTSAGPQTVYVAVSSAGASTSGTFDGTVRILPPPTNTTCAAATALTSGTTLTAQNGAAGTENLTGPCLATATGTVLYYTARVAAGEQLTLRARPAAGVDAVLRLLDGCTATACLASVNAAGVSGAETLVYTNTGAAERTVVVAVGGASNATNGFFDLDVNVRREYSESPVARACDDMAGGVALMGVGGDDTVSAITDLPFAFTFYGERQLEYAVSSNGLLQLFPTLMGTTTNTYDNQPIPTAAAPNRFVAAFWDDLLPVMGSSVLTRTLGTAPNRRFVVQWTNFSVFGDDVARMTFQAKLFETSNAIELHYCTLTAGMMGGRITGDSATIGIESGDGVGGRQHSYNAATSVSTTAAFRFAP